MTKLNKICGFALCAALFGATAQAQQETRGFGVAKETTLGAMRGQPLAFKNVWVSFTGQFEGIGSVHNPFFTRFTRADFVNFAMWADDQQIWKRKVYDDPAATLFIAKSRSELLTKIYAYPRYQRLKITGVVRNAFQGEPWIEVTEVEPIEGKISRSTIKRMNRAWRAIEEGRWQTAAIELNLASSGTMTDFARGWVHGYLGLCMMRLGKADVAGGELKRAHTMLPDSTIIEEWMDTLARDPRSAIDTKVRAGKIRKSERPMWEAVEQTTKNTKRKATPTKTQDQSAAKSDANKDAKSDTTGKAKTEAAKPNK